MKFTTLALAGLLAVSFAGSAFAGSCCPSKKKKADAAPVAAKKDASCATTDKDCPTTASAKSEGVVKAVPAKK